MDNDHLRGWCEQDLRPHAWSEKCFCYHCSRYRSGFEDEEVHDPKWCHCLRCFVVREKVKLAEDERADREERRSMKKLLMRVSPKKSKGKQVSDLTEEITMRMPDEEEDEENIVDRSVRSHSSRMFDLVRSGLRSPEE